MGNGEKYSLRVPPIQYFDAKVDRVSSSVVVTGSVPTAYHGDYRSRA
jgi:hypothetical protein